MNASIRKFLAEEDGITALEYGILAAVVAVIIATFFHNQLTSVFRSIFTSLNASIPSNGSSSNPSD